MSTIIVNTVKTTDVTTDQTITTANTTGSKIVIAANGAGVVLSGNSTANNVAVNATAITTTGTTLSTGNTTITGFANVTTTLKAGNTTITGFANVTTNTFTLGTSSVGANGYTWLPNGVKLNFGYVASNTTAGDITFTSAFTTTLYSMTVSAVGTAQSTTYFPTILATTTSTANVRTANATSRTIYYMALGD